MLLPVAAQTVVASGINPLVPMLPTTSAASAAFMLPVATPPNAVVFGGRLVPPAAMARCGLALNLLAVALLTLIFELWITPWLAIEPGLAAWAVP